MHAAPSPLLRAASGLLILAVSSATAAPVPEAKRRALEARVEGVAVDGTRVALATSGGLVLMDAAHPEAPRRLGGLLLPGSAAAVHLDGNLALLASGSEGLAAIDLSDPTDPRALGILDTDGAVLDLAPLGPGRYLLADGAMGLKAVDLTDPTRPRLLAALETGGYVRGLAVRPEGGALVAAGREGLLVVELTPEGVPRVAGRMASRDARAVVPDGDRAFLADGNGGLVIVDLERPEAPRRTGHWAADPHEVHDVVWTGRHLVLALGRGGLAVLEPRGDGWQRVGDLSLIRPAVELALAGTRLFVANDSGGLAVVDLARPAAPRLLNVEGGP
jgi:hypothetical protein